MAAVIIGPCMFLAPVVFVLMLLAIPLWPVAIVVVTVMWLVTWPVEQMLRLVGIRRADGAAATVARWLRVVVKPWVLFEKAARPPSASPPAPPGAAPAPSPPGDEGSGGPTAP